ncbi:hypothetical protein SISSUDRAFT_1067602 [Sistotremastrum suecicum HHB10207 ss-3]|uniref:Uncharacterized protein n=1 Tax=Sistotremastrum suecicum HHB10207 ss-3 TaxID=1314776 RepID=A0A165WXT6_9AGAM|nr:hypothetical protein SISSUDRAFT_1067602 [Sistotremastrum suecicum HHB10207 ss-3]
MRRLEVISDATVPALYNEAFAVVDANATGEVFVILLVQVMSTSSFFEATTEKIVRLIESKLRVLELGLFVALGLVSFAHESRETSIEQVATRSSATPSPIPSFARQHDHPQHLFKGYEPFRDRGTCSFGLLSGSRNLDHSGSSRVVTASRRALRPAMSGPSLQHVKDSANGVAAVSVIASDNLTGKFYNPASHSCASGTRRI